MESAANYYIKAGFENASTLVNASQVLFDAYVYMGKAEVEVSHEKKPQLYQLAEKCLARSAELYEKAGYLSKSDEVLKVLEKVREKREFTLSLSDVLKAPSAASSTSVISTPTPTHEEAVGLERFERANLQVHLTAPEEVTVGNDLEIRLDLVNVAKNFGLLVRIDDLVPKGFKVLQAPPNCLMENGSIDMKGKRLEPLKVESFKILAQAAEAGVINLNPTVVYVDDVGEFRTSKPETVHLTVHPTLAFEFKTQPAQRVFNYLTDAFAKDYMIQKLPAEKSGWRTLTQVVEGAKTSKSSVYGPSGRLGSAISELERRGLIETRIFPGERGRGGRILKARISYEKETVKRYVDHQIMKIDEK